VVIGYDLDEIGYRFYNYAMMKKPIKCCDVEFIKING
jgi:hypothetical protein